MTREWCEEENVHLPDLGNIGKKPKPGRLRCPKCKRRFLPIIRDCEDISTPCWHVYLPKHKTP